MSDKISSFTSYSLNGVTDFTPKEYFDVLDWLSTKYASDYASDYVYDDLLKVPLGFPDDQSSNACGQEFGRALCLAGAPPCSKTNGQTVRQPCSYCQALFNPSGHCKGKLSSRTYAQTETILIFLRGIILEQPADRPANGRLIGWPIGRPAAVQPADRPACSL